MFIVLRVSSVLDQSSLSSPAISRFRFLHVRFVAVDSKLLICDKNSIADNSHEAELLKF